MNTFYSNRRERFLNEEPYAVFVKWSENHADELEALLRDQLAEQTNSDAAFIQWSSGIAGHAVERLIGAYSAGEPIESLVRQLSRCILLVERPVLPNAKHRTEPYYMDEPDSYAYAMWLLSLTKLLRHDALIPRVAALFDVAKEENRGKDALFEALLQKLGLPSVPANNCLKNMKAHPLLLEAISAEPAQRPKHVARFLDKWYPSMKACYWHGRHTRVPQNFFGYWAFEAGLVTYLWDIDDSSYRDMPFYPKDLVDYARGHPNAAPADADSPNAGERRRRGVRAGEPCPETGFWFTPAKQDSRRHFTIGEVMPDVGGDYGMTIWQWALKQVA